MAVGHKALCCFSFCVGCRATQVHILQFMSNKVLTVFHVFSTSFPAAAYFFLYPIYSVHFLMYIYPGYGKIKGVTVPACW